MRFVRAAAAMLVLVAPSPGGAMDRPSTPKKTIRILDLRSPALSLTIRSGGCTSESEVARPDRPGASRVRCTRAMIVRHTPVEGRDTTILFWDPKHVERSLSVAGRLDGDRLSVSAVQPDNGGIAFPASGTCRLHRGAALAVKEPGMIGADPLEDVDSLVCTANRAGKRVLHVEFAETSKPAD